MVPIFQRTFPDDPRCSSLYEALIEREMILVSHAGREPIDRGEVFGTPERFARVVASYPDLRLVLTHLGGLRMWEDVRRYLLSEGRNVYFDTSYASFYLNREEMAGLIREISVENVLFGSDYPWADPGEAVKAIKELELSEGEKERILCGNAVALLDPTDTSE
jgi:predicted TIM-barrel fold metal-dependent hydrolase